MFCVLFKFLATLFTKALMPLFVDLMVGEFILFSSTVQRPNLDRAELDLFSCSCLAVDVVFSVFVVAVTDV